MVIGPGEPAQYLHRDCTNWTAYCRPLWPRCPEITVSTMIALEDMTEELGGTRVIPGSHLWEDIDRVGEPAQAVATEMPRRQRHDLQRQSHSRRRREPNPRPLALRDAHQFRRRLAFAGGSECACVSGGRDQGATERTQRLLGYRSYDPTPYYRSGRLWLKDFDAISVDAET